MTSINAENNNGGYGPPPSDGEPLGIPAATFTGGTAVQRAQARINYGARQYAQHLAAEQDKRERNLTTAAGEEANVGAFAGTACARDVDAALSEVEAWRDEAHARAAAERAKLATGSDMASQVAAQRTWHRLEGQLNAQDGTGKAAAAQRLLASASPAELAVLAEELGPYMRSQEQPDNWIDDAIAQHAPEYAAARAEAVDADRQYMKTRHNAQVFQRAVNGKRALDTRVMIDPT